MLFGPQAFDVFKLLMIRSEQVTCLKNLQLLIGFFLEMSDMIF